MTERLLTELRGLPREMAAEYLGITVSKFDQYVRLGTLPKPLPLGRPAVWDRKALDAAYDKLSGFEPLDGEEQALRAIHERKNALRHGKAKQIQP